MQFVDREDAGQQLAQALLKYKNEKPLVLGLPRGGVPVACEVAKALEAPLDVWVVRKVGAPDFPELGLGAVAEGGIVFLNRETIDEIGASEEEVQEVVRQKTAEVAERVERFRGDWPPPQIEGRTIILVDDGIATGGTVRAAIQALRAAHPRKIVLAVPVAASQSLEELQPLVDAVVCVHATPALYAIGAWYEDFGQVPDDEVVRLLELARGPKTATVQRRRAAGANSSRQITIPIGGRELGGTLSVPPAAKGLVLFAHGSGSSRFSPRNRYVASVLRQHGLATLLFDLLTKEEEALDEATGELRFDIELLSRRLMDATDWAQVCQDTRGLPLGYFGSSTGAAAALVAAARRPWVVGAVVSRGGRPDLARESLKQVRVPTLLIVGGQDHAVIDLNRRACSRLSSPCELVIIPGATHLFEEQGALDAVARLAAGWFNQHLRAAEFPVRAPAAQAEP